MRTVATAAARATPATRPIHTGRSNCESTRRAASRAVAPSATWTPMSFARCSTRYDSTLNRPDTVSTSASPPRTTATQNAIPRTYICARAMFRIVEIAPSPGSTLHEVIEQHLPGPIGIATNAQRSASFQQPLAWSARRSHRDGNISGASRPFTSRKTPTTTNERDGIGDATGEPDPSRRIDCPTALPVGQSSRAMVSVTTATPESMLRSAGVNRAPAHEVQVEHIEVVGGCGNPIRPRVRLDVAGDCGDGSEPRVKKRRPPPPAAWVATACKQRRAPWLVGDRT